MRGPSSVYARGQVPGARDHRLTEVNSTPVGLRLRRIERPFREHPKIRLQHLHASNGLLFLLTQSSSEHRIHITSSRNTVPIYPPSSSSSQLFSCCAASRDQYQGCVPHIVPSGLKVTANNGVSDTKASFHSSQPFTVIYNICSLSSSPVVIDPEDIPRMGLHPCFLFTRLLGMCGEDCPEIWRLLIDLHQVNAR